MSEPVAKQRPMINLDEFERRLRQPAAAPQRHDDDPLAELARLVGSEQDPYQTVFRDQRDPYDDRRDLRADSRQQANLQRPRDPYPPRAVIPEPPRPPQPLPFAAQRGLQAERMMPQPPSMRASEPLRATRGPASAPAAAPAFGGNFAAIEAGLRGSIQPDYRDAAQDPAHSYQPSYHADEGEEDDAHWLDQAQASAPQHAATAEMPLPARSHRLLYLTAAIIALGIGGIGATFAIKRSPASPQQIAMIKASTSPAKVQAKGASDSGNATMQDASVLDNTPQAPPVGVVNRVEQPVDLAVQGPQTAPASGAASVPVPTPPSEAPPWQTAAPAAVPAQSNPQVADASPSQSFGLGGMIQSRRVKTIAVRPDGSVARDDAEPSPPSDAAATPAADSVAPPPANPKATARVATPSRTASAAPAGADAGDVAPSPVRQRPTAHAKPTEVADLGTASDATDSGAGGGFAVQLAAAPTEAEAQHVMNKLAGTYRAEIGGHKLKFHRAKVGEKTVYRVRVGGMSKTAAVKLCQSLQAKGGTCFIAHD
ncbi:MAG: SPOR domain-containing protein [Methylovirgula sp.]